MALWRGDPKAQELEVYFDDTSISLEIMVLKHHVGSKEHEVHIFMCPQSRA
jgi:hypothetical protein